MNSDRTIIWDWNGTLIDDTGLCVSAINKMLKARHLPDLSLDRYLNIFTFPVIDYYKLLGFDFDKESWNEAAMEFMAHYFTGLPSCGLTKGAIGALEYFRKKGYYQAIISAMQHDSLVESVHKLEIAEYFGYIGGIDDHYAGSKTENALQYFKSGSINPRQTVFIGDTLHDAEVADELGCRCILVASGHQSRLRLETSQKEVIDSLHDIQTCLT